MESGEGRGQGEEEWTGGLPVDVWLEIVGWLDDRGLITMLLVSRSTHSLFSHPKIYRERLRRIWPSIMPRGDDDQDQVKRARCLLRHLSRFHTASPSPSPSSSSSSSPCSEAQKEASPLNELSGNEDGQGEDEGLWALGFKWRRAVMNNWEKGNVRLIRTITPNGPVRGLDFDEENNLLVLASKWDQLGDIAVCNLDSGESFNHTVQGSFTWVNGVYLRYGRLFSCSNDSEISIWELPNPKKLREMTGHRAGVQCLHFLPNSKHQLVSCAWDHEISLWDIETGKVVRSVDYSVCEELNSLYRVTCDENEQTIVATGSSGNWIALDFDSMNPIVSVSGAQSQMLSLGVQFVPGSSTRFIRCAFPRSSRTSATADSMKGRIEEHDVSMGSKEPIRAFDSKEPLAGMQIDGDDLIIGGQTNIIVRSLATGEIRRSLPIPEGPSHEDTSDPDQKKELVWNVKVSNCGLLASGSWAVHLWDVSGQRSPLQDILLPLATRPNLYGE